MLLFITIVVNALLAVIFNYFEKYKVDTLQAIVVNYFVCFLTGSVVAGELAIRPDTTSLPWFPYALFLGLLFVTIFFMVARTVQTFGLTIASIFQRMTMIVPTIVAITFFNESYTWIKIVGILLAILAILLINRDKNTHTEGKNWTFPIMVFIGSAIIETCLYYVDVKGIVHNGDTYFTAGLFLMAGMYGVFILLFDMIKNKKKFQLKSIVAGIILGIPNFFTIQLILKSLSSGLGAATVFPIINVGILLTSALFGLILFSEKFNKFKIAGLALAVFAIVLIAIGG